MSALEQRNKKQRAAPPQRDKRHAGEDTLDDDDNDATTPALAVELRTDGYRVAAMLQPAPLVEVKRARGQQKPPEQQPAFGEVRPYGTAEATALLRALDRRVLPRALAPGLLEGVVRLRIIDRRPGGGGPREVACRVGDEAAAEPIARPPRPLGAPLPKRSLADALDDDGGDDSDDSDAVAEEIVVAEPPRRDVRDVVDVVEEEEEAEEASVAALRARLASLVDVARQHGLGS